MLGTLAELAGRVGGRVVGDGRVRIERVTTIEEASANALTFATSEAYLSSALASNAAAILVESSLAKESAEKPLLVVENARHALAQLLASVRPPRPTGPFRHDSAVVSPDARLASDVYVDAHAYIGKGAAIGSGCVVGAGAYVGDGVVLGESVWVHARVTIMPASRIGNRVVLYPGCVIGSEGFGWAFVDGKSERIPQIGNVVLEDDVESARTAASIARRPEARTSEPGRKSTISSRSATTAASANTA